MASGRGLNILLVLVVLGGFYLFGETLRPLQSSLQHEYETWLSSEQETLRSAARFAADKAETEAAGSQSVSSSPSLPSLEIRIRHPGSAADEVFRVAPDAHPDRPQQLLRLLDLMKEAGVFDASRGPEAASDSEAVLHFKVLGPDRSFESVLTASDIERNVTSLLLVKLFREFSRVAPPTETVQASGSSQSQSAEQSSSAAH